jgi:predicted RNA-binding Zn ribbon-like protein
MLKIDNNLLQEVGLGGLPSAEKNSFLKHIYETLEMRVGIRLADQMSNEQLDEFERYFEAKDDAGAFKWLETNFPNYKEIVQQEFDKLKTEVASSAPQILAASQQQAANAAAPQAAQAPPVQQQPLQQPVQQPPAQQPQQPQQPPVQPQPQYPPQQPPAGPQL